jgi:hypothetical protein
MKFKDPVTGEYKDLHFKTGDTLPIGTIVSVDTDEIPPGYEEVVGEEARVSISPTEPITGEEVWIQKSGNIFDKNRFVEGLSINSNGVFTTEAGGLIHYMEVIPGEVYKLKSNVDRQWVMNTSVDKPALNGEGSQRTVITGFNAQIVIPEGHHYLNLRHYPSLEIEDNLNQDIKIELTNKIYIKNENEEYSEFYNEASLKGFPLWTNPNPNAGNFGEQQITLSSDNYDYYEVIFKPFYANPYAKSSGRIPKNIGCALNNVETVLSASLCGVSNRYVELIGGVSIKIHDCTLTQISATGSVTMKASNNNLVPLYIIGYRTADGEVI